MTRRKDDLAGTKAILKAGLIQEIAPAGCPAGTQILITEIFANVPARRKFLKTEATEQGLCLDAITRLALAHPEIALKLMLMDAMHLARPKPGMPPNALPWSWVKIFPIIVF